MDVWIKYEGPYLKSGPQETTWDWSVMVDQVTVRQESRLALEIPNWCSRFLDSMRFQIGIVGGVTDRWVDPLWGSSRPIGTGWIPCGLSGSTGSRQTIYF